MSNSTTKMEEGRPAAVKSKAKTSSETFKVTASAPWSVLLNPFAWLLWILDFVVWLLLPFPLLGVFRMINFYIFKSTSKSVGGKGQPRRKKGFDNGLMNTPFPFTSPNTLTAHDLFQRSFAKFATRNCMGTREFLGWHKKEGVRFPLKKFGETHWKTYEEVGERVKKFGAGLRFLGMEPLPREACTPRDYTQATLEGRPHTMLVYEETCADWTVATMGAFSQSLVVATSYSTLGIGSVADAVQECGVSVIVCNYKDKDKVLSVAGDCPTIKAIICTMNYVEAKDIPPSNLDVSAGSLNGDGGGPAVLSMEDVISLGSIHPVEFVPPAKESVAVVMYTSGSTGKPKGVVIQHKSIVSSVAGAMNALFESSTGEETYLAYLPAAHILEFCAQCSMFSFGASVGYADPKTISSSGAVRQCKDGTIHDTAGQDPPPGGIQEFRPTVFAAVPKIWDILKKGVETGIGAKSPVVKFLFRVAFAARAAAVATGRDTPLFNAIIFKKLKDMLGGRMRLSVTGGGPCSAEVQTFIRTVFQMPLVQGYALTETTCAGAIQSWSDPRNGVVGPPLGCVEMELRSCDITDKQGRPYHTEDRFHGNMPCLGRGEICIRSESVSAGYLHKPDKTAEEFDSNGWFTTGDVGVWTADGSLMIVDRIKNLVKLLGGEYIAVEAMEAVFNSSVFCNGLNGGVMVYGDGAMDRAVALVQANESEIKKLAMSLSLDSSDVESLCTNADVRKAVLADLNAAGTKAQLGANEKLAAVALISGLGNPEVPELNSPWTPENGYLTASNKLQRKFIQEKMEQVLNPLKALGVK